MPVIILLKNEQKNFVLEIKKKKRKLFCKRNKVLFLHLFCKPNNESSEFVVTLGKKKNKNKRRQNYFLIVYPWGGNITLSLAYEKMQTFAIVH